MGGCPKFRHGPFEGLLAVAQIRAQCYEAIRHGSPLAGGAAVGHFDASLAGIRTAVPPRAGHIVPRKRVLRRNNATFARQAAAATPNKKSKPASLALAYKTFSLQLMSQACSINGGDILAPTSCRRLSFRTFAAPQAFNKNA
jgi:hypothetical protein